MKIPFSQLTLAFLVLTASRCRDAQSTASGNESTGESGKNLSVAFYNVENLFDTQNDPEKLDDDFTPDGKYHWTEERLHMKLDHLADALHQADTLWPDVVGMCEVENRNVVERLTKETSAREAEYGIIHKDSPDERGIDVCLLYKKKKVEVLDYKYYSVVLPDSADPNTRDILYARIRSNGEILHLFANHWPSRSGGELVSEPHRLFAAAILREKMNALLAEDPQAKILVMGDFNDYPANKSLLLTIEAGPNTNDVFFNYMFELDQQGEGTYWYKGDWGTLDQFIGSWPLVQATSGWSAPRGSAHIVRDPLLLFTDDKGQERPNRTYAGEDYKGGYSDHLPVIIHLVSK